MPGTRAVERFGEALGAERLQQVVDRVHLERADRVTVVGGDEDDGDVAADELEHVEPVELRHLDVEQQQVRLQLGRGLHGLEAVGALGDDLDVGMRGQPLAKNAARQRLVVDDRRRECGRRADSLMTLMRPSRGIRTSTRNRPDCSSARTASYTPNSVVSRFLSSSSPRPTPRVRSAIGIAGVLDRDGQRRARRDAPSSGSCRLRRAVRCHG